MDRRVAISNPRIKVIGKENIAIFEFVIALLWLKITLKLSPQVSIIAHRKNERESWATSSGTLFPQVRHCERPDVTLTMPTGMRKYVFNAALRMSDP